MGIGEHGSGGDGNGVGEQKGRSEVKRKRNGDKIGRNGSEGGVGEGGKTLTSSFCKPRKLRTVRGTSLGLALVFGRDGRRKRRSPLRENRNYV